MTRRIKRIRTVAELEDLKEAWESLERNGSIFQSWPWVRAWCGHATNSNRSINIRLVEDGAGRPLAIVPLYEEALGGPLGRLTHFIGYRFSPTNDALLLDPSCHELAEKVGEAVMTDLGPVNILHLRHLDGDSILTRHLISKKLAKRHCHRILIPHDSEISDQRMRLSGMRRKKLRKAERQMREQMDVEFRVETGSRLANGFDEMVDLHHRRFASVSRSSLMNGEELLSFKAAVLALGHRSEVIQLRANGSTVGAQLMIRDRDCYYFIQSGFDPGFGKFSPMWQLHVEVLRRGFEEHGCEWCDFGAGYEAYKYCWKPVVKTNYFCCYGDNTFARALAALYGAVFQRKLPPSPPK